MKRIICLFLCILLAVSLCACHPSENQGGDEMTKEEMVKRWGENYDPANAIVEQDKYLFGMCYITPWAEYADDLNKPEKVYQLLSNLGVKSLRHWIGMNDVLADPKNVREGRVESHHRYLAMAKSYDFQIIGVNGHNYLNGSFQGGKHPYQPWEGSDYYKWLEDYEESWFTLVSEFPEITYWEIDNEINNPGFMCIYGNEEGYLPPEEMVAIALDMMLYASRGIHRANPNAITIMGSLTEPWGCGIPLQKNYEGIGWVTYPTSAEFLEMMYQAILTGEHGSMYPDDFFQCASWHPYYWYDSCACDYWVNENNKLYDLILKYEGKDKKVFLTEMGWLIQERNTEEEQARWIPELYQTVLEKMPYVESVHFFRLFDNLGEGGQMMGLFYDPDEKASAYDKYPYTGGEPGAPRPAAYAYQKMTGATGSLLILREGLDD